MFSVTEIIRYVKQPYGGFIRYKDMEKIKLDDGVILNEHENVHGSIIGMSVDYLTRFIMGAEGVDAFHYSLNGAFCAGLEGMDNAYDIAFDFLEDIKGLDDKSIVSACKLVTFDVWYRNPIAAMYSKDYSETEPDNDTIQNIRILVNRSLTFFEKFGPIVKSDFNFNPEVENKELYNHMMETGKGTYGGYTSFVSKGDGDFLTDDTMWEFKVTKTNPNSKQTMQLLMYWIMGLHSNQWIYKNIRKLGIFNPRHNAVYLYHIGKVPLEYIRFIEDKVIRYDYS